MRSFFSAAREQADRLVILDQGRIVEQGTHAELVALEGAYCQLLQRQLLPG